MAGSFRASIPYSKSTNLLLLIAFHETPDWFAKKKASCVWMDENHLTGRSERGRASSPSLITGRKIMDESRLQAEIRKYRFLLTESLNVKSLTQVEADRKGFFRALHREYKAAQELIIAAQLEIEADIASSTDEAERLKKTHWKAITELCFNTLIWICLGWERDAVKRVFKGPKHGSSTSRNAASALKYRRLSLDLHVCWRGISRCISRRYIIASGLTRPPWRHRIGASGVCARAIPQVPGR